MKVKTFVGQRACARYSGPKKARASALAYVLMTTAFAVAAPTPRDVDAIFAKWAKPDSPGCALAVMRDGKIIYERGYGSADLEHDVPITPGTVFYVGSVSKQFTAAAIALLAQRGALSLDDDVRKFVPEVPDYGSPITVRHLIHHTSGLRDYLELRGLAGEPADGVFGDADALALIARQKALNFPTGTQYLYSNSGYFLLGQIIKRVSGQTLRDFAGRSIFQPLRMSTAQFRYDHAALIKNRAHAYAARSGGASYGASEPNFDVYGAGGLFMSVRDFLQWDENFYSGQVGGAEFVASLVVPGKLNDGKTLNYAFGLMVGKYRGLAIVEHGGAYGGFRAHVLRFPEQHFSVACFGNLASLAPGDLARQVADLYLADKLEAAAPATTGSTPPRKSAPAQISLPGNLGRFAGEFFSEELQANYTLAVRGGQLLLRIDHHEPVPLRALGPTTFSTGGAELKFERAADESVGLYGAFVLKAGRVRGISFVRR